MTEPMLYEQPIRRLTGYMHHDYAGSLAEFGTPRELPRSGGWLLERLIPGTESVDAMGCYPLFSCHDWSRLHMDLDDLEGKLVSVALVADPFGNYDRPLLERCFDTVVAFKEHFVADLSEPPESIVSHHHRTCALKALDSVHVHICQEPLELLEEWIPLYRNLIEKHGVRGIRAFSRMAFATQLGVPGMVALRAERKGVTIAANLFYAQGETVYDHLLASSPEGYQMGACYALNWCAIQHFMGKARWIDWGGGSGTAVNDSDGLIRFKRGWAQRTRPTYFCGRILDVQKYHEQVKAKELEQSRYFPAYRDGEFS